MILDTLTQSGRYASLADQLLLGFDFLSRSDLASLDDGRHEIDAERVFAIVARDVGRGKSAAPLEFHRRYIDIQYVISGSDTIGWSPLAACRQPRLSYDAERDIGFFDDPPQFWLQLQPGDFAIFFPHDAHAPLAGDGPVHKVVVKVQSSFAP